MSAQDYDYGVLDYLQSFVWYLLIFVYIHYWGWMFGLLAYGVSYNVFALFLKAAMSLEVMSGADEGFFLDDKRNCTNIIAYQKCEKFNGEEMAKAMTRRATIFPRIKSRVTKFLGRYMFEEMSEEWYFEQCKSAVVHVNDVHTEKELADLMAKE